MKWIAILFCAAIALLSAYSATRDRLARAADTGGEYNNTHAEIDYGRTCLAQVGFSEARDQGPAGMAAVMQVVLNRTRDARWPTAICDVTSQSGQFIALDSWAYPRDASKIDGASWQLADKIAGSLLSGVRLAPAGCAGATHFDKGDAQHGMVRVCQLGAHSFYVEPVGRVALQ